MAKKEKRNICRIQNNYYKMKGGRILGYQITVLLGSIPFIAILTWKAQYFGLSQYKVFWLSLLLCGDVMLFPWILISQWKIFFWLLSIIFLVFSSLFIFKRQGIRPRTNATLDEKVNIIQRPIHEKHDYKEELMAQFQDGGKEQPEEEIIFDGIEEIDGSEEIDEIREPDKETLIKQLIEEGFTEKCSNKFYEAVGLFFKALSLNPEPDLALSLIIDCFWLWSSLGKRDYGWTQLEAYIKKYLPQFDPELRHQFDSWIKRENLYLSS